MNRGLLATAVISAAFLLPRLGQAAVLTYDIASWNHFNGPLAPVIAGGGASATSLAPINGAFANTFHSDQYDNGKFWFGGWAIGHASYDDPAIAFSITAQDKVDLTSLRATLFTGIWSDLWAGPDGAIIYCSTGGATPNLLASVPLTHELPFNARGTDVNLDLSSLPYLTAGETAEFRFVFYWNANPKDTRTLGGFVNTKPGASNLVVTFAAVPEPTFVAILPVSAAALLRRRHR